MTFCTEMYTLLRVFHKSTGESLAVTDYSVRELPDSWLIKCALCNFCLDGSLYQNKTKDLNNVGSWE